MLTRLKAWVNGLLGKAVDPPVIEKLVATPEGVKIVHQTLAQAQSDVGVPTLTNAGGMVRGHMVARHGAKKRGY
jgi:hypothetical protein